MKNQLKILEKKNYARLLLIKRFLKCNTVYSGATSAQSVYSNGIASTILSYNINDPMIFVVQISDLSLRSQYYVDFVSATLTSDSISFTVTPASTI